MIEAIAIDLLDQRIKQAKEYRARLLELASIEEEIKEMTARMSVTKSRVVAKEVIHITAAFYDVSPGAVTATVRTPKAVDARQTAMFFLVHVAEYTQSEVGRLMKRDHGTVIHALRTVQARCDSDPVYAECVKQLKAIVTERLLAHRQPEPEHEQCAQAS